MKLKTDFDVDTFFCIRFPLTLNKNKRCLACKLGLVGKKISLDEYVYLIQWNQIQPTKIKSSLNSTVINHLLFRSDYSLTYTSFISDNKWMILKSIDKITKSTNRSHSHTRTLAHTLVLCIWSGYIYKVNELIRSRWMIGSVNSHRNMNKFRCIVCVYVCAPYYYHRFHPDGK